MRTHVRNHGLAARVICLLAAACLCISPVRAQIGVSVALENNEVAPSVFVQGALDSMGRHFFEFNLLPFTVIPHDHYNDKNSNVSMFPFIRSVPVIAGMVLLGVDGEDLHIKALLPDSSVLRDVALGIIIPFFLANSQLHFTLSPDGKVKDWTSRVSAFAGMQTDYFVGDAAHWFRFAPALGIELMKSTSAKNAQRRGLMIGIQAGVARRIDISGRFSPQGSTAAFVTLKIGGL
jgi:hypothetical protein